MNRKPLVSGIIIFLNGANFLEEAIESVLNQTYDYWELFLVDDGSTDRSTEIALQYSALHPGKIRYLHHDNHQNRGKSASRNLGLHYAKGEYIAFLDHDDVWLPNKLEEQVAILESQPEAGMMYGRTQYWHSWTGRADDSERDGFTALGLEPDTLVKPPYLVTLFLRDEKAIATPCSVLIRREVAISVGGFEESFRDIYEDVVFFTKIYLETPVFVAGKCWDRYRQHPENSFHCALRAGRWHPKRRNVTRKILLDWAEQYISAKGVTDIELLETLRTELLPYRQPEERTPTQKFYDVCWDAGLALVQGEDPSTLVRALGTVYCPELDSHMAAEQIFEVVPFAICRASTVWLELWPALKQRTQEFFTALEAQAQVPGFAREMLRVLERFIEHKWVLRVAGGSVAWLRFPADDPDMVRIAIAEAKTKTGFDIQLNQPRLTVRSKHHYQIGFRARADQPRRIFLGFAKAHDPWNGLGLYKEIDLTSEWQSFEVSFVATADEDNARIHFDVGEENISVELSSVTMRRFPDGETVKPQMPQTHMVTEPAGA